MSYVRLKFTIQTLINTALEKVNVLGIEDAQGDLWQIYDICQELLRFWEDELTEDRIDELEEIMAELPLLKKV